MSRLASISSNPILREFAQGAAQDAIMPVADFLAPTVPVATSVGRYKKYTEKNRFRIPQTLRTLGGRATELRFEAQDQTYNCKPHALDYPTAIFRTGNAPGTDTAFAEGVAAIAAERIQYVLPYSQHRKAWVASRAASFALDTLTHVAERRLVELTTEASPKLGRLGELYATPSRGGAAGSKGAYLLRDTLKVLGAPELGLTPAKAGIFYANAEDPLAGGTGHTIRVCLLQGVPTVFQTVWPEWMG
jgi:hypothetical protein